MSLHYGLIGRVLGALVDFEVGRFVARGDRYRALQLRGFWYPLAGGESAAPDPPPKTPLTKTRTRAKRPAR